VKALGKQEEIKFEECLLPFRSESSLFSPASVNVRTELYGTTLVILLSCMDVEHGSMGICGPKREEVAGHLRLLHSLYFSPNTLLFILHTDVRSEVVTAVNITVL
jgi:hypothetical protein